MQAGSLSADPADIHILRLGKEVPVKKPETSGKGQEGSELIEGGSSCGFEQQTAEGSAEQS